MNAEFKEYYHYLLTRSLLGRFYRQYMLYPKLTRNLRGRVLDVGCGLGDFLAFRRDTIGVDINPLIIDHCRRKGLNARLIKAGKNLPFSDRFFDGVVLDNVLEHLLEPAAMLLEIRRVLKDDGRFIAGVPGKKGFASDPDHKVYYDELTLERTINSVGFEHVCFFYMPLPFRSHWMGKTVKQHCLYGIFRKR